MYVLVEGAIERYLGYFEERSIPGDYGITVSLNVAVAQLEDFAISFQYFYLELYSHQKNLEVRLVNLPEIEVFGGVNGNKIA